MGAVNSKFLEPQYIINSVPVLKTSDIIPGLQPQAANLSVGHISSYIIEQQTIQPTQDESCTGLMINTVGRETAHQNIDMKTLESHANGKPHSNDHYD